MAESGKTWAWENIKRLTLELSEQADADIIRQLESKDSPEEYLKRLVREDMTKRTSSKPVIPAINPEDVTNAEKNFEAVLSMLKKVVSK
ncbi:MAG: hypothetical protein IJK06_00620 [Clostridia bacterium]|nr:hypothetical protein [Clostridia bacterium]